MAVAKKKAEEVTEVTEPVKEEVKELEISVNTETKPAKEQLVRVKPNATYTTKIGGTYYYFEKGVCQNVPENVKRIMAEGDMLTAL